MTGPEKGVLLQFPGQAERQAATARYANRIQKLRLQLMHRPQGIPDWGYFFSYGSKDSQTGVRDGLDSFHGAPLTWPARPDTDGGADYERTQIYIACDGRLVEAHYDDEYGLPPNRWNYVTEREIAEDVEMAERVLAGLSHIAETVPDNVVGEEGDERILQFRALTPPTLDW